MIDFDTDHATCLKKYFKTGRKECQIIKHGDGHRDGLDVYNYGQQWKRGFIKAFENEKVVKLSNHRARALQCTVH